MRPRSRVSDKIYSYLVSTFGDEAANNYSEFVEKEPAKYIRVNEKKINAITIPIAETVARFSIYLS